MAHGLTGSGLYGLGQSVSTPFAVVYAAAAIAAAGAILWSRGVHESSRATAGILALAGFTGLSYTGVVVDMQIHASNDPSAEVASVRRMIPPGERLVSFGPVHHLFAYYFGNPIELEHVSGREVSPGTTATYFCFNEDPSLGRLEIPFAWDRIAVVSCERARSSSPLATVVVGKRKTMPAQEVSDEEATAQRPPQTVDLDSNPAAIRF